MNEQTPTTAIVSPPAPSVDRSALLLDLYGLTMAQSYLAEGLTGDACFELFVRRLPPGRNFLVAAGLDTAMSWLESLRFSADELDWLARERRFSASLLDYLGEFRFTGDEDAPPEGSLVFPGEPLLQVRAPLPQAQLLESRLLNLMQFQTVVASKAARCVLAARGRQLVDFGLRRAHGAEAGLLAARAAWLAGFDATSNVAAGRAFGLPLAGTVAHAYVQAHATEIAAFHGFVASWPRGSTLLIDTYDTERAAFLIARDRQTFRRNGVDLAAVRIDSGDLDAHARAVRAILDSGGLPTVDIFASGGLDEHAIARLLAAGAPIDGFGVGTALAVSEDAPALDCAYKLVAYAGRPTRKRSEGKATWPGVKQVYRRRDPNGQLLGDQITLAGGRAEGEPLLAPCMRAGQRVAPAEPLGEARMRCMRELSRLSPAMAGLEPMQPPYPVTIAPALRILADTLDRESR